MNLFDWVVFSISKDLSNFPFCIHSNALIKIKHPSYLFVIIFLPRGLKDTDLLYFFLCSSQRTYCYYERKRERRRKEENKYSGQRERERKRERKRSRHRESFQYQYLYLTFSFHKIEKDLEEKDESRAKLFSFILDPDSNFLDSKRWSNCKIEWNRVNQKD